MGNTIPNKRLTALVTRKSKDAPTDNPLQNGNSQVLFDFWDWLITKYGEQRVGTELYTVFFAEHPEHKKFFKGNPDAQAINLIGFLKTAFHKAHVRSFLRDLGARHIRMHIPLDSYQHLMDALLVISPKLGGKRWNKRTEYCARRVTVWIVEEMRKAEGDDSELSSSTRDSMAVARTNESGILNNFEKFLDNDICLKYYHKHMMRQFAEENTHFLKALKDYKQKPTIEHANEIISEFILPDSEMQINLSFTQVKEISAKANAIKESLAAMFNDSEKECHKVLRTNGWESFRNSPEASELFRELDSTVNDIGPSEDDVRDPN
eukprot:504230_1